MVGAVTAMRAGVLLALVMTSVGGAPSAFADQAARDRLKAEEQEMLARARQEAGEQRGPRRLEGTVDIGSSAITGDTMEARKREDELQRLSDKLRRASQMRTARTTGRGADVVVGAPWTAEVKIAPATEVERPALSPESRSALGHRSAAAAAAERRSSESHATVLMVMTPGDRGIRRLDKTADPILCANDGCYISNGTSTAARYISLRRSFGFLNTFGPRAGACRNQTACVFRGVDVSASNAILQPVDLRVVHHDRRAIKAAQLDETCKVDAGRLSCDKPVRGDDFILWVVPESVANRAGTEALQRALADGLSETGRRAQLAR